MILKVQNNIYEEETFNVTYASTAQTFALRKFTLVLVLHAGPETQTVPLVPLWFNGQQFQDDLMKPAKRKTSMTQNPA